MPTKRFLLMMLVMLMSVMGAWAQNNVIRYTATEKLNIDWYNATDFHITTHEYDPETQTGVVTFNGDIIAIMRSAFKGLTPLISIEIPASVTTIDIWGKQW